ncbi:VOC family protein [Kribbella sp. NPDC049174]|uniref:VOC family protein n=1 Tax=Kribbella sp. NPDC049174 TaxID=3364112 RepID=UPI00371B9656
MRLLFELRPVEHLEASVDYYRELGLEPIAWPSDDTALLGPRGQQSTIALVRDPAEGALGTGGVYDVGDIDTFFEHHRALDWLLSPADSPLGRYAVFADRTGTAIRLLDPAPGETRPSSANARHGAAASLVA